VLTFQMVLIKAFLAGGVAALPLGPMGIWCLQRTLGHGRRAGLLAAAGIATALGLWGWVVVHGLELVSGWLAAGTPWVRYGLGIALLTAGANGMRRPTPRTATPSASASDWGGFAVTFCGVVTNPVTLVTLAAVFGVIGLVRVELDAMRGVGFVTAIGLGAMTLWIGLAELLLCLHQRWGEVATSRVSRALSGLLVLLGASYLLAGG
jgi:putative LysE/RhtB family amino acid efflux pump